MISSNWFLSPGSVIAFFVLLKFSRFLSTGFYSGLSPVSPGTAGTIACVALWFAGSSWLGFPNGWADTAFLALLVTLLGITTSNHYIKYLRTTSASNDECHLDPGFIVIDEWAGMLVALCGTRSDNPGEVFAAFVLFRLFDILKPPPVSTAERLPGAWGVMLDDVVAGFIALGILGILRSLHLF